MSVFLLILAIISVLALIIVLLSLLIRRFGESFFRRIKSVKPKIIIYRAEKKDK